MNNEKDKINRPNNDDNLGSVLHIVEESEESELDDYQTTDKKGRRIILTEPDEDIMSKKF